MTDKQKKIYELIKRCYKDEATPKYSELRNIVKILANSMMKETILTEQQIDEIINEYEVNIGIKSFEPDSLISTNNNSQWFDEKKREKNRSHSYWERYEDYLLVEKDFPKDTIRILKKSTEEILSYCANPTAFSNEPKKRKGLVVGDVQSGKTANYMALINMACDYDYKLIIVLAGLTDSLRMQTQERVDEGFIGAISNTIGSSNIKYVGVGNDFLKERYAVTLTNLDRDFKKDSMNALNSTTSDYNKPVILVVKKNKSTLENVKKWLKPGVDGVTDHILIIDDEADNASVNTKKTDDDPSTINALIRDLYNNFSIASYVGYTATPFANIFINPDDEKSYEDLFPTDFISLLKTPTSYFGCEKVFGKNNDGKTRYIREIDEDEYNFLPVNHKKDDKYNGLSNSLKEAIQTFFLNCVIRTLRGKPYVHRTMMINISRFNKMQTNIKIKVSEYVEFLRQKILQSSYMTKEKFLRDSEMLNMYNLFMTSNYYDSLREEVSWDKIQFNLSYEAEKMKIIVVNRLKDEEKLDYRSYKDVGARYIVIGGFVLSRGLTLEGLMISYYSRNGSAYDSLLQMCRWFGYRPKYEDLCRIYMSHINVENFGAVIEATNHLKQQFINMKLAKKTPNDFGLMVKTCPDITNTLLVTSRNKSRHTIDRTITLNYSCTPIDTSKIFKEKSINEHNISVIRKELEDKLGKLSVIDGRYMYRNVDKNIIISILRKISIPFENRKFDTESISGFLEQSGRLRTWDVVIATGNEDGSKPFEFGGARIPPVKRKFDFRNDNSENFVRIAGNNNRLMDPGILNSGLDKETREEIKNSVSSGKTPTADDYLKKRQYPILVIYPIDLRTDTDNPVKMYKVNLKENLGDNYLIGFGIGFPYNGEGLSITYKLNVRMQQQLEKDREAMEDEDE